MHPELPLEFLRSFSEVSLWVSLKFLLEFLSEFPSTVSLSSSSISAPLLESELPLHGCRGLLACTNFGTAWAIYEKEERIAEHTQALRVCSTGEHGAALIERRLLSFSHKPEWASAFLALSSACFVCSPCKRYPCDNATYSEDTSPPKTTNNWTLVQSTFSGER